MRFLLAAALLASCMADKPAVAPTYEGSAAQAAPPAEAPDEYGAPAAPAQAEAYGAPAAPVQTDSYGSPAAPVQQNAPVGNQGYYYYYYPVRQNAAAEAESDDGLLGGLLGGGLLSALLGKKVILLVLGITAVLVVTAFGLNIAAGRRSFTARALEAATPYMTEENLIVLADYVRRAVTKFD